MRHWFVGIVAVALALFGFVMPVSGGIVGLDLKPGNDKVAQNDADTPDKTVKSDDNAGSTDGVSTEGKDDTTTETTETVAVGDPTPEELAQVKTDLASARKELEELKAELSRLTREQHNLNGKAVASLRQAIADAKTKAPTIIAEANQQREGWLAKNLARVAEAVEAFTRALLGPLVDSESDAPASEGDSK